MAISLLRIFRKFMSRFLSSFHIFRLQSSSFQQAFNRFELQVLLTMLMLTIMSTRVTKSKAKISRCKYQGNQQTNNVKMNVIPTTCYLPRFRLCVNDPYAGRSSIEYELVSAPGSMSLSRFPCSSKSCKMWWASQLIVLIHCSSLPSPGRWFFCGIFLATYYLRLDGLDSGDEKYLAWLGFAFPSLTNLMIEECASGPYFQKGIRYASSRPDDSSFPLVIGGVLPAYIISRVPRVLTKKFLLVQLSPYQFTSTTTSIFIFSHRTILPSNKMQFNMLCLSLSTTLVGAVLSAPLLGLDLGLGIGLGGELWRRWWLWRLRKATMGVATGAAIGAVMEVAKGI
ncbi:hypothetical protein VP01_840g1 [Puccinia sorghi]|uniref:Uncharacterized protein n=1 Tax=Puccinia sorghi TaxID=27349 RepID=A0A0L6U9D6_9BASI|nr:hypothetical protein VP01_840g1 [Puccinia sorghi]